MTKAKRNNSFQQIGCWLDGVVTKVVMVFLLAKRLTGDARLCSPVTAVKRHEGGET
jgi:hypothetical protein